MQVNRILSGIWLMMVLLTSCIEEFTPELEEGTDEKYVVSGILTDKEGYQYVEITRSSSAENPSYKPVSGAYAEIMDDRGNIFSMEEEKPGSYRVWMESNELIHGVSYQVRVITPGGEELASEFDRLTSSPPIDSIYYKVSPFPERSRNEDLPGIQFYIDLEGSGSGSNYYKFEIEETWERRTQYPKQYYYDGEVHRLIPPDSSLMFCWHNLEVAEIFTLSTGNLSRNSFTGFPIHYVAASTSRLSVLYSAMIRQYTLTRSGYEYWDELRINSTSTGGLYEQQPLPVQGNINNLTSPGREVLGSFNAAGLSEKRIFIREVPGLEITFDDLCGPPFPPGRGGFEAEMVNDTILYFIVPRNTVWLLDAYCVDCLRLGGSTTKPEFWPDEE